MKNNFNLSMDIATVGRYNVHSKPVGPLPQGMLSLGGCFFRYSRPAGLLSKDKLTSAGFSFYRGELS
ncbi:MAG: hypothetical protein A2Y13_02820 [Planctomycetes bacterium GWC2_45_44]|nr:MAG: hypothetical protein A2Y13_02820 [Planctomycetes bacterium GWC2_45_44]HBR19407.1 hypothetical protein [Phycisphaerales bacterium]